MSNVASPSQSASQSTGKGSGGAPDAGAIKRAAKSGWSRLEAHPGDELILATRLSGFAPNTTVLFKVCPATGDPNAPLANLKGVSDASGFAFAEWIYIHDPIRVKEPRLLFEAEADGLKTISHAIRIVDWIELTLE